MTAAVARRPLRRRSRERFEAILGEAERATVLQGDVPSIPALAETLGYTRASIYHFFPTPDALRNELIHRSFIRVAAAIEAAVAASRGQAWLMILETVIGAVATFYSADRLASALILEGPRNAESVAVQEDTSRSIGTALRRAFHEGGLALPTEPDVAWILVGLVDSMLRFALLRTGDVDAAIQNEIVRMGRAYLATYATAHDATRS